MSSPYDGLTLEQLLQIQSNLVKILSGSRFAAQNVPGLSYARRIDSLQDVRTELGLVNAAIENLTDPDATDRVTMRAI